MTRLAWQTCACIVLGVMTSVAVAWVAATTTPDLSGTWSPFVAWAATSKGEVFTYADQHLSRAACLVLLSRESGEAGRERATVHLTGLVWDPNPRYPVVTEPPRTCHPPVGRANRSVEFQFGWPLACAWGASQEFSEGCDLIMLPPKNVLRLWPRGGANPPGLRVPEELCPFPRVSETGVANVPSGILWLGLVADTAVYAPAWCLVLVIPRQIRALRHRRRNQCISCGYDLAGNTSGVCPECGRAIPGDIPPTVA